MQKKTVKANRVVRMKAEQAVHSQQSGDAEGSEQQGAGSLSALTYDMGILTSLISSDCLKICMFTLLGAHCGWMAQGCTMSCNSSKPLSSS